MRHNYTPRRNVSHYTRTCSGCGRDVLVGRDEEYVVQVFCPECSHKSETGTRMMFCDTCNSPMLFRSRDAVSGVCPNGHVKRERR